MVHWSQRLCPLILFHRQYHMCSPSNMCIVVPCMSLPNGRRNLDMLYCTHTFRALAGGGCYDGGDGGGGGGGGGGRGF